MQSENVSKFSSIDLAQRMENNSINAFRLIDGFSWADLLENDTTTEFVSGLPIAWMNTLFRTTNSGTALEDLILKTQKRCDQLNCPMLWKVSGTRSQRVEHKSILEAHGLSLSEVETAMVLDSRKFRFSRNDEQIRVERVHDYAGLKDWLTPYAAAFSIPNQLLKYFERLMTSKFILSAGKENWFVSYLNDTPVASASSLFDSDITMIYNVGTVPRYVGRGFARLTTEAAIKQAYQCKQNPVALYATTQAFPLFRNMGFDELHEVENYLYQPKTVKESEYFHATMPEAALAFRSSSF